MLLHDAEELEDDLGARADEDLSLALALGVDDRVQGIVLMGSRFVRDVICVSESYPEQSSKWRVAGRLPPTVLPGPVIPQPFFSLTRTETRTMMGSYR